jgi:hypothetical protein
MYFFGSADEVFPDVATLSHGCNSAAADYPQEKGTAIQVNVAKRL